MVGKRLLDFARIIAEYEGWQPDDLKTLGKNEETVAFRFNNPGNLRTSPFAIGEKNGFAYFYNEDVGFYALVWDLYQKCTGNTKTGLKPSSTIADLMNVYAPSHENNTEAYITHLENRTGLSRTMQLKDLLEK